MADSPSQYAMGPWEWKGAGWIGLSVDAQRPPCLVWASPRRQVYD